MNDIQETCQKNAAAALTIGRRDVAKVKISVTPSEKLTAQLSNLSNLTILPCPNGGAAGGV